MSRGTVAKNGDAFFRCPGVRPSYGLKCWGYVFRCPGQFFFLFSLGGRGLSAPNPLKSLKSRDLADSGGAGVSLGGRSIFAGYGRFRAKKGHKL